MPVEVRDATAVDASSVADLFYSTVLVVVGFAEMEDDGHGDTLYVHHEHQGRGIASRLLVRIEAQTRRLGLRRLYTEASITAEPFGPEISRW